MNSSLAKYIDHTLLRPGASEAELKQTCEQAREFGFYSVCVYWNEVGKAAAYLRGSDVLPIAVVGFPSGTVPTAEKVSETRAAVGAGAREIDMVINREFLKAGKDAEAKADIQAVVAAAGVPVKVILETSELSDEEKRRACRLAVKGGAQFVKTSTGFSASGATEADVRLMRECVGPDLGVKASGGIRSHAIAMQMISAGASRLGTSASVAIVQGATTKEGGY